MTTPLTKVRADDAQLMLSVFTHNKIVPNEKALSAVDKELVCETLASVYKAQAQNSKITDHILKHHTSVFKENGVLISDAESIVQTAYKRVFNASDIPVEEGKVEMPRSLEGRIEKIAQKALYAFTLIPKIYLSFIVKVSGSVTHIIFHHNDNPVVTPEETSKLLDEQESRTKPSCCQRVTKAALKKFSNKLIHNLANLTFETVVDKAIQTALMVAPYYIYQAVRSTFFEQQN